MGFGLHEEPSGNESMCRALGEERAGACLAYDFHVASSFSLLLCMVLVLSRPEHSNEGGFLEIYATLCLASPVPDQRSCFLIALSIAMKEDSLGYMLHFA